MTSRRERLDDLDAKGARLRWAHAAIRTMQEHGDEYPQGAMTAREVAYEINGKSRLETVAYHSSIAGIMSTLKSCGFIRIHEKRECSISKATYVEAYVWLGTWPIHLDRPRSRKEALQHQIDLLLEENGRLRKQIQRSEVRDMTTQTLEVFEIVCYGGDHQPSKTISVAATSIGEAEAAILDMGIAREDIEMVKRTRAEILVRMPLPSGGTATAATKKPAPRRKRVPGTDAFNVGGIFFARDENGQALPDQYEAEHPWGNALGIFSTVEGAIACYEREEASRKQ